MRVFKENLQVSDPEEPQNLISAQWLSAMSEFVIAHFAALQAFVKHASIGVATNPGYDFIYFTNMATQQLHRAEVLGLRSQEALDFFLMATWLSMAVPEVSSTEARSPVLTTYQPTDICRGPCASLGSIS